jgi:hypothetical protein
MRANAKTILVCLEREFKQFLGFKTQHAMSRNSRFEVLVWNADRSGRTGQATIAKEFHAVTTQEIRNEFFRQRVRLRITIGPTDEKKVHANRQFATRLKISVRLEQTRIDGGIGARRDAKRGEVLEASTNELLVICHGEGWDHAQHQAMCGFKQPTALELNLTTSGLRCLARDFG